MSVGFGLTIGPLISALVIDSFGFAGTYFFFAFFILIFGALPVWATPNRLDDSAL